MNYDELDPDNTGLQVGGIRPEEENHSLPESDERAEEVGSGDRLQSGSGAAYFREIAKFPLLSAMEERRLADALRTGKRLLEKSLLEPPMNRANLSRLLRLVGESPATLYQRLGSLPGPFRDLEWAGDAFTSRLFPNRSRLPHSLGLVLSETEWIEVNENVAGALLIINRSREALIVGNLRLVVSIALKYSRRTLALADLIQEGNLGLMKAVERYDHRKGNRFSSYAVWWIHQSISRAIDYKARTIRVPSHLLVRIRKIRLLAHSLSSRFGREPDSEEVGRRAGISPGKVDDLLGIVAEPLSLESPPEQFDQNLGEVIRDSGAPSPEDGLDVRNEIAALMESLSSLSSIQRKVIEMHYGLIDDRQQTLAEIGRRLSLTKERIRQIRNRALHRLNRYHEKLGGVTRRSDGFLPKQSKTSPRKKPGAENI